MAGLRNSKVARGAALSVLALGFFTVEAGVMIPTAQARSAPANTAAIPAATGIFATESPLTFHAPDFTRIKDTDYQPAIEQGIAIKRAEIAAIAANRSAAWARAVSLIWRSVLWKARSGFR